MAIAEGPRASYDLVMSEAITFDTHRFVRRLTGGGFTVEQAETLAEEQVVLLTNLATKVDIDRRRQETKSGIEWLRQELKTGIAEVGTRMEAIKSDLMKWLIGAMIAPIGTMVAQSGLVVGPTKLL